MVPCSNLILTHFIPVRSSQADLPILNGLRNTETFNLFLSLVLNLIIFVLTGLRCGCACRRVVEAVDG